MSTIDTIAFQGVAGAHSDVACRNAYPYMNSIACPSFADVFKAVKEGKANLGMIPVGNTKAGRVAEIHNLIREYPIHIVGEHFLKIEHHLLAKKGTKLENIKKVYSHPQALMQCRENLETLGVEAIAESNTAAAAKMVAESSDNSIAALASNIAAEVYGLEVVKDNMQDADDNTTLFLSIADEPLDVDPKTNEKILTTAIFTTRNIPAGLYKALGGFATNNINMVKIESYIPEFKSEAAQFFITIEGHPSEKNVRLALEELGFFTNKVEVLGVYPAAKERYL